MGDTLSRFEAEKMKLAFTPAIRELAKRFGTVGLGGLKRGWEAMSPKGLLRQGAEQWTRHGEPTSAAKGLSESIFATRQAQGAKGVRAAAQRNFGAGVHLGEASTPVAGGGLRQGAEELSRRGWTGMGRLTKYVPIGEKSQVALGTAASLPYMGSEVASGRKGIGEAVGETAGFALPAVLASGTGSTMAGLALPLLASHFAGKAGRAVDSTLNLRRRPHVAPEMPVMGMPARVSSTMQGVGER